jgi:hypothetical protein
MTQDPPFHHILLAEPDKMICNALTEHLNRASHFKAFALFESDALQAKLVALAPFPSSPLSSEEPLTVLVINASFLTTETHKILHALHEKGVEIPILIYGSNDPKRDDEINASLLPKNFLKEAPEDFSSEYQAFLPTPFHPRTLISRVRELIIIGSARRVRPERIVLGGAVVHPLLKQIVTPEGKVLKLTEKECGIVLFLYHNRPSVVSRQDLLSKVWGYNAHVTTHTLETHIYRLRQKLEMNPATARILITESGGYRLDI